MCLNAVAPFFFLLPHELREAFGAQKPGLKYVETRSWSALQLPGDPLTNRGRWLGNRGLRSNRPSLLVGPPRL